VNSSRQILYASKEADFAAAARRETEKVQADMETILRNNKLIG
jgi:hypothetical protein